jgi:hypothetical protein
MLTIVERKFSRWKNVDRKFLENWLDNSITLNLNRVKLNRAQFMCDEQVAPFHNPQQHHIHMFRCKWIPYVNYYWMRWLLLEIYGQSLHRQGLMEMLIWNFHGTSIYKGLCFFFIWFAIQNQSILCWWSLFHYWHVNWWHIFLPLYHWLCLFLNWCFQWYHINCNFFDLVEYWIVNPIVQFSCFKCIWVNAHIIYCWILE